MITQDTKYMYIGTDAIYCSEQESGENAAVEFIIKLIVWNRDVPDEISVHAVSVFPSHEEAEILDRELYDVDELTADYPEIEEAKQDAGLITETSPLTGPFLYL